MLMTGALRLDSNDDPEIEMLVVEAKQDMAVVMRQDRKTADPILAREFQFSGFKPEKTDEPVANLEQSADPARRPPHQLTRNLHR